MNIKVQQYRKYKTCFIRVSFQCPHCGSYTVRPTEILNGIERQRERERARLCGCRRWTLIKIICCLKVKMSAK